MYFLILIFWLIEIALNHTKIWKIVIKSSYNALECIWLSTPARYKMLVPIGTILIHGVNTKVICTSASQKSLYFFSRSCFSTTVLHHIPIKIKYLIRSILKHCEWLLDLNFRNEFDRIIILYRFSVYNEMSMISLGSKFLYCRQ